LERSEHKAKTINIPEECSEIITTLLSE